MRRLLGGAGVLLLAVVSCGDDGAVVMPSVPLAGEGGAGEGGAAGVGGSAAAAGAPFRQAGGADAAAGSGGELASAAAGAGGAGGAEPSASQVLGALKKGTVPYPGVVVLLDGQSTITDEQGRYAFLEAPPSYQLTFIFEDEQLVRIYDGLTTRAPVTSVPSWEDSQSASISGSVLGAGAPTPLGRTTAVTFVGSEHSVTAFGEVAPGSSSFELHPLWRGPEQVDGEVQVLQWEQGAQGPEAFTAFGRAPFSLVSGQVQMGPSVQLAEPPEVEVAGAISLPASVTITATSLVVGRNEVVVSLEDGPFSLLVPALGQQVFTALAVLAESGDGSTLLMAPPPPEGDWDVTVPAPPRAVLPVAAARGVTGETAFSWTAVPERTVIACNWFIGSWTVSLMSLASKATLPDLSPHGLLYTSGPDDSWWLEGYGPAATLDDAMASEERWSVAETYTAGWRVNTSPRALQLAE